MRFLHFHPLWYRVEFRREWVVNGEEELRSRGDYIPKECNIQCISVHCNIHCNIQYERMQIPSPLWQVKKKKKESFSCSVVSSSLGPHGLYPTSLPLSIAFSRRKYWSGLTFPSPGNLPNPGIKPLQADSLPSDPKMNPSALGSSDQE